MYRDIPEDLRRLVEPVIEEHGLELVDAELRRGARPWGVQVTVDRPEGDGQVAIGLCAEISREIATQLEAADAIPEPYRLQVSSPGMDRKLAREKDFGLARGREVRVETRRPLDGRRRFRGRLVGFEQGTARLCVDGQEVRIPFEEVAKANIIYAFSSSDFAGSAPGRSGRRKRE